MNLNASNARMALKRRSRGPAGPRRSTAAVTVSLFLLTALALTACGPGEASKLVVTQSTDVPSGADHKGHLAPGGFMGITLSIRNTGAGPARGVTVEDVLPAGVRYYQLEIGREAWRE